VGDEQTTPTPDDAALDQLRRQAEALLDRCRSPAGTEDDLEQLEIVLEQLPEDEGFYHRGYVGYQRNDDDLAVEYLGAAADQYCQWAESPPECAELFSWVLPFILDPLPELWVRMAAPFGQKWPDSAAFCLLRGYAELHGGGEEAAEYFERCLAADASYWPASAELGNLYFDARDWKAARAHYQRAAEQASEGEKPILYFNLGLCYAREQEFSKAIRAYRACLEWDGEFQFARNNLGKSLMRTGRYEEAVEVLREAVEAGTDGDEPRLNLAKALRRMGCFDDAVDTLRQDPGSGGEPDE